MKKNPSPEHGKLLILRNARILHCSKAIGTLGKSSQTLFAILHLVESRDHDGKMTLLQSEEGLASPRCRLTMSKNKFKREGDLSIQFDNHTIQYRRSGPADIVLDETTKVSIDHRNGGYHIVEEMKGMKFVTVGNSAVILQDLAAHQAWEAAYRNWHRLRTQFEAWERLKKGWQARWRAKLESIIPAISVILSPKTMPEQPPLYPSLPPEEKTMSHEEFLSIIGTITEGLERAIAMLQGFEGPTVPPTAV